MKEENFWQILGLIVFLQSFSALSVPCSGSWQMQIFRASQPKIIVGIYGIVKSNLDLTYCPIHVVTRNTLYPSSSSPPYPVNKSMCTFSIALVCQTCLLVLTRTKANFTFFTIIFILRMRNLQNHNCSSRNSRRVKLELKGFCEE